MRCRRCGAEPPKDAIYCDSCGAALEIREERDPFIGQVLLNQYVIQKKLGAGGFGAVYQAEQPSMRRKVAVKTLHRHFIQNKQIVKRFHREGLAASQLEHPYAIKVYTSGETEDGTLWLAMEFLPGETLEDYIKREGPLTPEALLSILGPVCEVLAEAHQKGIIHRDLKPENIMLVKTPTGLTVPKVLDFGIAGLLENDGSGGTQSGVISGTPKYMSPEQWKGLKHTDAKSDIYSLGIIAYQCLSLRLPFDADSVPQWMHKHCLEAPLPLESALAGQAVPKAVIDVVMKALEKEPSSRYPSALAFKEALACAVQNKDPSSNKSGESPSNGERPNVPQTPSSLASTLAIEAPRPAESAASTAQASPSAKEPRVFSKGAALLALGVLLLGGAALLYWYPREKPEVPKTSSAAVQSAPVVSLPATTAASAPSSPCAIGIAFSKEAFQNGEEVSFTLSLLPESKLERVFLSLFFVRQDQTLQKLSPTELLPQLTLDKKEGLTLPTPQMKQDGIVIEAKLPSGKREVKEGFFIVAGEAPLTLQESEDFAAFEKSLDASALCWKYQGYQIQQ